MPFGMAHWTLQSNAEPRWFFDPKVRRVHGLRCTHQFSPWVGDYGFATFLPFSGNIDLDGIKRTSSYDAEHAHLTPYSLQLFLLRYRVHVELVPTDRCAVLSATFETSHPPKAPGLLVDIPCQSPVFEDREKLRIRFTSTKSAGGTPENFATYFVLAFQEPWTSCEVRNIGDHRAAVIQFQPGRPIEAKIGTSFISFGQAELNLEREIGSLSTASLREAAMKRWDSHLGRIEIEGATTEQQQIFYSCFYRTLLFPRTMHEPDALGEMRHFSAFSGKVELGVMYADHVFWDVYRAWYPLMSILFPERLGEILQAWINGYKEGGWLPQCPAPGYRACMTGTLTDSVFADAVSKEIAGFDIETTYEALQKNVTMQGDPTKGYGRVGLDLYLRHHYLPADQVPQSVAETTDAAYGDFCIAQVAKALGKTEVYAALMERSGNWRNLFDPEAKFLRGKNADGSWVAPFETFTWGSPYVEGSAWQHRWNVPHDIEGVIAAMGGETAAVAALEKMLTLPPEFNVGVYEFEIHEMSEMAAVPFGQYAHSNQPVHHLLYIFAHAKCGKMTQLWVRKVMQELYTKDSFPGDEDTGSMSAWFILSALGFYPLCPGRPEYTLGSPLFPRAALHLPKNKMLLIEAPGNAKETVYVRSVSFNGQPHSQCTLSHATLVQGGTLAFAMISSA